MSHDVTQQIWDSLLCDKDAELLDRLLAAHPDLARRLPLLAEHIWSEDNGDVDAWSTEYGNVLMLLAKIIVRHGGDLEARSQEGLTPLMLAAKRGNVTAAEFLIQCGSIVEARDDNGQNILHFAADERDLRLMTVCLDAGLDPNLADASGRTPLHVLFDGSYSCCAQLTSLLLSRGAAADARDELGQTSLHLLANDFIAYRPDEVKENALLLLMAGADPFNVADDGSTPWSLASQNDNADFLAMVRDDDENFLSAFGNADHEKRWRLCMASEPQALEAIRTGTAGHFSIYTDEPKPHSQTVFVYAWGAWFLVPSKDIDFDIIQRLLMWDAPRPFADYLRQHPISALLWTEAMHIHADPIRLLKPKLRLDILLCRACRI